MGIEIFKKHLREKRAVKIIAGIDNYNADNVARVCRAAQKGHASAVDISCDKKIYDIARKNTKLPIFVSSVHPFELWYKHILQQPFIALLLSFCWT